VYRAYGSQLNRLVPSPCCTNGDHYSGLSRDHVDLELSGLQSRYGFSRKPREYCRTQRRHGIISFSRQAVAALSAAVDVLSSRRALPWKRDYLSRYMRRCRGQPLGGTKRDAMYVAKLDVSSAKSCTDATRLLG